MVSYAPNIVLTGFSGTGKTTVGRRVAQILGRRFVDMDDVIARRAGREVSDIFIQEGETAFRALEAAACAELSEPQGLVVATGGGAVVSPANREALATGGVLICLTATVETILERLAHHSDRPLLAGEDRVARISQLLSRRIPAYAAIPNHLPTDGLSVPRVAERILGIVAGLPAGGHRLRVSVGPGLPRGRDATPHEEMPGASPVPGAAYDVLIANGLIREAGARMAAAGLRPGRCAVVTNPVVSSHHLQPLLASLHAEAFEPVVLEVEDGEAHKTLASAALLYEQLAAAKLARNEPVVALGGGVTGDLAGFVASTWLRGVPFIQIPTTLLSMVDASVGGKVGVDLSEGKNLVGAFKQPEVVIIDPSLLATLPPVEFRCGVAEMIKSGIIGDAALFGHLEAGGPAGADLTGLISDAVRVKADLVMRDPYERGERAWLNLGHTFGHALELLSHYALKHGEAVALGLIAAADLSVRLGLCADDVPARVCAAVTAAGLPTRHPFDPEAALEAMATDKKRVGRSLRFVAIERIGRVRVVEGIDEDDIRAALETIRM